MIGHHYAEGRSKEDVMGRFPYTTKKGILIRKRPFEISNEFQNLKKGDMSVSDYAVVFTEKMKLVSHLVPAESKVERFVNRLPTAFGPMVKLATTLEVAI